MTIFELCYFVAVWVSRKVLRQSYNLNLGHIYKDLCQDFCFDNMTKYSQDSQDIIQEALIVLVNCVKDNLLQSTVTVSGSIKDKIDLLRSLSDGDCINLAFSAVNTYIKSLKKQSFNNNIYIDSLEEILENDGDMIFDMADFTIEGRYINLTKLTHAYINNLDCLTKQEKRVCILWVDGYNTQDIAKKIGISTRRVDYHRASIKKSLAEVLINE